MASIWFVGEKGINGSIDYGLNGHVYAMQVGNDVLLDVWADIETSGWQEAIKNVVTNMRQIKGEWNPAFAVAMDENNGEPVLGAKG